MTYWLHPEAEEEATEAAVYYAATASSGVAKAFVAEFERVLALLERNQNLGTRVEGGLRIHPFRRFPYSIVFRPSPEGPQVYAVSHQKREPGHWRHRL